MTTHCVYILLDVSRLGYYAYKDCLIPSPPFYVGLTNNLDRRLNDHKYAVRGKGYKEEIIKNLKAQGLTFGHVVYADRLTLAEAKDIERELINYFGRLETGGILGNSTGGGSGQLGYIKSKETIKKHRKVMRDIWRPVYKAKLKSWKGVFEYVKGFKGASSIAKHWCIIHGEVDATPANVREALTKNRAPCPKCSRHLISGLNISRRKVNLPPVTMNPSLIRSLAKPSKPLKVAS